MDLSLDSSNTALKHTRNQQQYIHCEIHKAGKPFLKKLTFIEHADITRMKIHSFEYI
jgi:hypothetical protein